MNVEQTLTDELRGVASSLDTPPPPAVAALVREAGLERNRTLLRRAGALGLVAAVVVGAIVIGSHVGRPSSAPQPAKPSPSYYAAGVPYVLDGKLYVDHKAQPGRWRSAASAERYTAAVRDDDTLVILRDGVPVEALRDLFYGPTFSHDGTKLAWITATPDEATGTLVVRDMSTLRDLDRLTLTFHDKADSGISIGFEVLDDDGTVHYMLNDRYWAWKPGAPPVREHEPLGEWVNPEGFAGIGASIALGPDHLWGAWLTDASGDDVGDGAERYGVTVQKPGDPDSRFTMPMPPEADGGLISWESPTLVLVMADTTPVGDVRCDLLKRTCSEIRVDVQ